MYYSYGCECIRMSEKVEKTGERTLAVVTKADKAPEGLLEKVTLTSVAEALTAFMRILSSSSGEFDEKEMHSTKNFDEFLMEEVMVLQESKGIGLPNFLPRGVFLNVLHHSVDRVREIIGMEKLTDYTCNPDYLTTYSKFMEIMNDHGNCSMINLEGVGVIDVGWKIVENEIIQDVMALHGGGIERMLNESQQDNRNPYLSHTVCGGSLIFVLILLSAVFVQVR
uniref:Dynamin stalk domain-containing protein n=1 Tax=Solanum lycopersicum TaxID=4081 RepID=A0A3Q7G7V8_SOLLC